ncbi:MAG: amidohydrolase family protein [Thermodesulfobacteriota bacterium]
MELPSIEEMIRRRSFLKIMATGVAAAAAPALVGCAGKKNIPKLEEDKPLALTGCRVVDVVSGQVSEPMTLFFEKGRISAISPNEPEASDQLTVVVADGLYAVPGLIDGHCHCTSSGAYGFRTTDAWFHFMQIRNQFGNCLDSGVTTLRDTGAFPGLLHPLMKEMDMGTLSGPRIYYCNSVLNIKGGHPDINPKDISSLAGIGAIHMGVLMTNFADTRELKRALDRNCLNAYFVKLTVDNVSLIRGKVEIPVYSDDHLRLIFRFAENNNLPVAAHCLSHYGFSRMMDYPVSSLEHVVADQVLTDREVETMARKGVNIVPTMTLAQVYLAKEAFTTLPEQYDTPFVQNELMLRHQYLMKVPEKLIRPSIHEENMEKLAMYQKYTPEECLKKKIFLAKAEPFFGMATNGVENLKKMKQAGINIGAGMDAGLPFSYFGTLSRELEMLTRIGFTPLEALQAATVNNAKILGVEDRLGQVQAGMFADVVLLSENPVSDIAATEKPGMVFMEGKMVSSASPMIRQGNIIRAGKA